MVERRNYQKYYEIKECAISALKQWYNIFELCQYRFTFEQITEIEEEIYPYYTRKPLSTKKLELLKNVFMFFIIVPQTSDLILYEEIIKPMVKK